MIQLDSPRQATLHNFPVSEKELRDSLSYTDKRVDFELAKVTKSIRRLRAFPQYADRVAALEARQAQLKLDRDKTLLRSENGVLSVPSGLAHRLSVAAEVQIHRAYDLPEPQGPIPWAIKPEHKDRDYQVEAHDRLLASSSFGPCGVELATGAGKSTIIRNLIRTLGLKTLVMTPSKSIAQQLFKDLLRAFGSRFVGLYGDGKKQSHKQIVVGIDDSLTRVQPSTPAWNDFAMTEVFIADESHLCPAETLAKVCFGLAGSAPYRFFFSGTQLRNDGLDLVLEGITGPIVLRKNVRELVDEGYLARPHFRMVRVKTDSSVDSDDVNVMTRAHVYYNRHVYETAAKLANQFVEKMQRPTLILVEEVEQFGRLLPHLKHKVAFAHGPLTPENKNFVPKEYHEADNDELVDAFNRGEVPILVGTSCIATGTDIKVAEAGIYLMGGKSEIKLRQGVGRETRGGTRSKVENPWTGKQKLDCVHVDFDVVDPNMSPSDLASFPPHRHAKARADIYRDIYGPVDYVDMNE